MEKSMKINSVDLKHIFKIRNAVIKLICTAPESLKYFCITYKDNDINMLQTFKQKIAEDEELEEFLNRCEAAYLYNFVESEFKYDEIIYYLFEPDEIYINNAKIISEYLGLYSMEFVYIVLNYIDDNFPIVISRPLSQQEKDFINFLLYEGSENEYMKSHNISEDDLNTLIRNICDIYKSENIKNVLNSVLIEEYLKKDNEAFLSIIK